MEEQQTVINNDTWVQKFKKFYSDNFPTDKQTCSLMLTLISMVLSGLNFITLMLALDMRSVDTLLGFGVIFVFIVITCGINYLFYRGFISDDHKQISLWFVVKSVEIMGNAGVGLAAFIYNKWIYFRYGLYFVIPYPLFIALNIIMVLYVSRKVKQMKKKNYNNIYLFSEHMEPLTLKEKKEKKNTKEEQPAIGNNTWVQKVKKFYINNFPADNQTYNLTLISMVLSGLNFIILTNDTRYVYVLPGYGAIFVFTIVMCHVHYLFYQGFLLDDHKHISPWFVVKTCEIAGIVAVVLFCDGWWYIHHRLHFTILYPALTVLDILMLRYVSRKVKQMIKKSPINKHLSSEEHMEPLTSKEKEDEKIEIPQL